MGHHLIIDDVSFGKTQVDEWKKVLKNFQVLWVGVKAPLPVLEQREKDRANRILGSARGQFHKVHVDTTYNLEVDTHQATPDEIAKKIKSFAEDFQMSKEPLAQKLNITLVKATKEDKTIIQNLGRFYVYEMSRFCGFLPGWQTPSNGLFGCRSLRSYCEQSDRHAFLIKVDGELAGFVLINKIGSSPDVDWNIGEFFVISKFQEKGVGGYVAEQVFSQFPGIWETSQMPENKVAIDFWEKIVDRYTKGRFEKNYKIIPKPKPHPMIVLKFVSSGSQCQ
jgi:predicted acetyltransferase